MKIMIDGGPDVDTERDLTPPERHVLQKLFGWKDLVSSVADFRLRVDRCLAQGWNNSGPISASESLLRVVRQMEKDLDERLHGSR